MPPAAEALSQGSTCSASGPSYHVSAARRTSTSGGSPREQVATDERDANAVRARVHADRCLSEWIDVGCGDRGGTRQGRHDGDESTPGREVEHPTPSHLPGMLLDEPGERETPGPGERPERDWGARDAEGDFRGVPDRGDIVREVKLDPDDPGHRLEPRVVGHQRPPMRERDIARPIVAGAAVWTSRGHRAQHGRGHRGKAECAMMDRSVY